MKLIKLTESDKMSYNGFVAAQDSGSFLQSWEWGEWQESLGRGVVRFFILDENQNIAASLQAMKTFLLFGRYYLYIPYGPVVDRNFQFSPLRQGFEGQAIFNFQKVFNDLISKFPKTIFIRVEPKIEISGLSSIAEKSINIQPGKTLILDLTKPEEELLSSMHVKTRYNIRLAQKHGVRIEKDLVVIPRHGLYFKEALQQIVETTKRQGFRGYPRDYYINLINFFALKKQNSDLKIHIYKALYQQELLASGIMVDFGNTRTYLFGGSSLEFRQVMAPYLMHWQAMLDAKEQGFKFYDFWGIETTRGEMPGFVRFKLGFGGQIKNYPGAYEFLQSKIWYQPYRIFRFLNRILR